MATRHTKVALLLAGLILSAPVVAQSQQTVQQEYFTNWPAGDSPQEIGNALAEHFVATPPPGKTVGYPEVCAWYGALTFAEVTHDDTLRGELIARFAPLLPNGNEASRVPTRHHVDASIFGVVPLEIAIQTHDPADLKIGTFWADRQWKSAPGVAYPSAAPDLQALVSRRRRASGWTTCTC